MTPKSARSTDITPAARIGKGRASGVGGKYTNKRRRFAKQGYLNNQRWLLEKWRAEDRRRSQGEKSMSAELLGKNRRDLKKSQRRKSGGGEGQVLGVLKSR